MFAAAVPEAVPPLVAGQPPEPAVAVLPFDVRAADPELAVWEEGLVVSLAANLDGVEEIRTIDCGTVLARWSERVPKETTPDLALARLRESASYSAELSDMSFFRARLLLAADRPAEALGEDPAAREACTDLLDNWQPDLPDLAPLADGGVRPHPGPVERTAARGLPLRRRRPPSVGAQFNGQYCSL